MIDSTQEVEQGRYPQPTAASHQSSSQSENNSGLGLTESQTQAFAKLCSFVNSDESCFILRGYAGTGKTFLIRTLVEILRKHNFHVEIMAPTGRAAVTIHKKTGYNASTIHSAIYRHAETTTVDDNLKSYFDLADSSSSNTIYIVDESSMISDTKTESEHLEFGSGRLLNDLIDYSKILSSASRSKIIFIGDSAQLPPVKSSNSPALDPIYLNQKYGINADQFTMTDVVRQAEGSDILNVATHIRESISKATYNQFKINPCQDTIQHISPKEIVSACISSNAFNDDAIIIAYKNTTALAYNKIIRDHIMGGDGLQPVCSGERLIVIQNSRKYPLLNGDFVHIVNAAGITEHRSIPNGHGVAPVELVFRDVKIKFKNNNGVAIIVDCKILDTLLWTKDGNGGALLRKALYIDFIQRHPELKKGTQLFNEQLARDPYFNALHVKFGYAITCHKAQGGEWANTVVVFDNVSGAQSEQFFRWSYTAITRCRQKLFLINAPNFTPFSKGFSKPNREQTVEQHQPLISAFKPVIQEINAPEHSQPVTYELIYTTTPVIAPVTTIDLDVKQDVITIEDMFKQLGITVTNGEHFQYKERFYIERENEKACLDFTYTKMGKITGVSIVKKHTESVPLFDHVKTIMSRHMSLLIISAKKENTLELYTDETTEILRDQLTPVVNQLLINIDSIEKKGSWLYRVLFTRGIETACIDFNTNKKHQFSNITPQATLGNSQQLLDQTYQLLESLG